ncbi:MAG: hypothetical protein ACREER_09985 [Alphaproteobacteria bacterium]
MDKDIYSLAANDKGFEESLRCPEDGMGYHLVNIENEDWFLLNSVCLVRAEIFLTEVNEGQKAERRREVIRRLRGAAEEVPLFPVANPPDIDFEGWSRTGARRSVGAAGAPKLAGGKPWPARLPLTGTAGSVGVGALIRYTAFDNDRRFEVDPQNSSTGWYRWGTWVSTKIEASLVPSGAAAVGRYALPVPLPAVNFREFFVPADCMIEYGTCRPAFAQAGGGGEVCLLDNRESYDPPRNEQEVSKARVAVTNVLFGKLPEV